MKSTQYSFAAILALSIALTSCSEPADTATSKTIALVTMSEAISGDLPIVVTGFGDVQLNPNAQQTLTAEIEARVVELRVQPGDSVEEGQVIVNLAPSAGAGVEIARAQADAHAAEAAAARARRLRADGLASDADVEAAMTNARDAKSLAASLRKRAELITALTTPISGAVEAIFVGPGTIVSPGTQVARIVSPEAVQAKINVEISDVSVLRPGFPVLLDGLNSSREGIHGTIRMVDRRVDTGTRMAAVFVSFAPSAELLVGEAVRAKITAAVKHNIVLVPRQSVFMDEAGSYVFVESQGVANLRRVKVGVTVGGQTEIETGIQPGEKIVVEGAAVLSDGMNVRISTTASDGGKP